MIQLDHVDVTFGEHRAVRDLDLEIAAGEFFTLLGPSGCGKTTALRTLAGFTDASAGRILIDDRDVTTVPSEHRGIGMVFQSYALFPTMSVRDNIGFGLEVRRTRGAERARLVDAIADRVGLSSMQLSKHASELSGGQQQRVAIARALVLEPKILLLDEPLSNLDAKLRIQLREQLKQLQQEVGVTTVYVTHDQEEALALSDRIAVLRDGRVEQVGTPTEIYEQSATSFVCDFIGEANRLPNETVEAAHALDASIDVTRQAWIRPEHVAVDGTTTTDTASAGTTSAGTASATPASESSAIAVDGIVERRSYRGAHSVYTVTVPGGSIRMARSDAAGALAVGDRIRVALDRSRILQYDMDAA